MTHTADASATATRQSPSSERRSSVPRLAAFIGLLAMYLLFVALLLLLGYRLWPALAGAAAAFLAAADIARRVLASGTAADPDGGVSGRGTVLLELVEDPRRELEREEAQRDGSRGGG